MTLGSYTVGSATLGGGIALVTVPMAAPYQSLHTEYRLFSNSDYSETVFKTEVFGGSVSTWTLSATDYDDAFDLCAGITSDVTGITFALNDEGYVVASSATSFKPTIYAASSITNAAKFNALWGILGFDLTYSYVLQQSHTATSHPIGTAWWRTTNKIDDQVSAMVDQAIGIRGHARQIGKFAFESATIKANFITKETRNSLQVVYARALDGAKLSYYNGTELYKDKRWQLDEASSGGISSILSLKPGKVEYYDLNMRLVDNTNG